ncbi:MAG: hypothetical protein Q8L29_00870 [archaeon]|nr:hypothetical protein [archaeon]
MVSDKKGEITSTQIVMIVLAIAGFAIVLYLFFFLDFGEMGKRETCHLSVLTRGTVAGAVGGSQSLVPLECITDKICITDSLFGKCSNQFAGEKDITVVRLSGGVEEKRIKIEEISANAMYDCWNMMGQGKIDIFGNFYTENGLESNQATCVVCSRIALDESVIVDILNKVSVNEYMRTHNIPGKEITYLQAFTDKGINSYAQVSATPGGIENFQKKLEGEDKIAVEGAKSEAVVKDKVNRELAFVFMQVRTDEKKSTEGILKNIGLTGATAAGATFMMPVIGNMGSALYALAGGIVLGTAKEIYGAFNAYESQITAAGYCGAFQSAKEGHWEGCSVVNSVNYDFKAINSICKVIQGNP